MLFIVIGWALYHQSLLIGRCASLWSGSLTVPSVSQESLGQDRLHLVSNIFNYLNTHIKSIGTLISLVFMDLTDCGHTGDCPVG